MSHPAPPPSRSRLGRLAAALALMAAWTVVLASPAQAAPLAAGSSHFCAITDARALSCWGSNDSGQLGTGDTTARLTPAAVPGLTDVHDVSANGAVTCAVTGPGELWCWGLLAPEPGKVAPQPTPQRQQGMNDVVDAEVLPDYTVCALLRGGTVTCHRGSTDAAGTWREPNIGAGVVELSGTCARRSDNAVVCWDAWNPQKPGVKVRGLNGATAITSSASNLCGTFPDGAMRCSGEVPAFTGTGEKSDRRVRRVPGIRDATGLGTGSLLCVLRRGRATCTDVLQQVDTRRSPTGGPRVVAGLTDARSVASTSTTSCALRAGGEISCWGANDGQSANGSVGFSAEPIEVPGLTDVRAISAGGHHTCALRDNGHVVCWGGIGFPAIGSRSVPSPTDVRGLTDTAAVVNGQSAACAISTRRIVRCWGLAGPGGGRHFEPTKVGVLPPGAATPSGMPGCFPVDGKVRCTWITAPKGRSRDLRLAFQTIDGYDGATSVASGESFHCAVTASTGVTCHGAGYLYPVERGTVATGPTPLPGIVGATKVLAAATGACALLLDATLTCWGPVTFDHAGPSTGWLPADGARVPGFSDLRAATAKGAGGLCAVTTSGSVLCARKPAAVLGWAPPLSPTSAPYAMPGISDAVDIVGGREHTCVLRATRTVACWGLGSAGQLGDGPAPAGHGPQARPSPVPGLQGSPE